MQRSTLAGRRAARRSQTLTIPTIRVVALKGSDASSAASGVLEYLAVLPPTWCHTHTYCKVSRGTQLPIYAMQPLWLSHKLQVTAGELDTACLYQYTSSGEEVVLKVCKH